ncbi:hypothetical protein V8V54_16365, partial [Priestia megaterium]|uniref:hypothetical protein n=1 Tax=Priestia megaterium TaxID=1404 RepID=UPI003008F4A6
ALPSHQHLEANEASAYHNIKKIRTIHRSDLPSPKMLLHRLLLLGLFKMFWLLVLLVLDRFQ